jgi:hypothetical protein
VASIDILKAVCWGLHAWQFNVTSQTIQNCFKKALDSSPAYKEPVEAHVMEDIQASFASLKLVTHSEELLDIKTFIEPAEEEVKDSPEDIEEMILSRYAAEEEENESSSDDMEDALLISLQEAYEALLKL